MKRKGIGAAGVIILAVVLLFLYIPVIMLAVYSFTDSTTLGAIRHFSMDNYRTLFTTPELRDMIFGTLALAFGSSVLATLLGTFGAIGAYYGSRKRQGLISAVNQIPVINADVVTGFSLCVMLVITLGVDKSTYVPLVTGHTVMSAPFVYLAVLPRLKSMDPHYYEAALDLGATPMKAIRKVIIPDLRPGIVSGFFLALTLSLDDYFIATYTKPSTFDTISTYVVNATRGARTEIKTALWALSTILFVLVMLIALSGFLRHSEDKGGRS